jgi:hypothetical protein
MNIDIFLQIVFGVLTVFLTGIGVEMANNPPQTDRRKWMYRSAFLVAGIALIGVNSVQAARNTHQQQDVLLPSNLDSQGLVF